MRLTVVGGTQRWINPGKVLAVTVENTRGGWLVQVQIVTGHDSSEEIPVYRCEDESEAKEYRDSLKRQIFESI